MKPALLHRNVLQMIDHTRVCHKQQGTELTLCDAALHRSIGLREEKELTQLAYFLLWSHLLKQSIRTLSHRRILYGRLRALRLLSDAPRQNGRREKHTDCCETG